MSGVERRTTMKWGAAVAGLVAVGWGVSQLPSGAPKAVAATGYGKDPPLVDPKRNVWPLTLDEAQRRDLAKLVDIVVPGIDGSPKGSDLGLVDFFDEWLSAPYPDQQADADLIMPMLKTLGSNPQSGVPKLASSADPKFRRFCTLAAAAYHTTPEGIKALGFVGNEPRATFDGPPPEVLRHFDVELAKLDIT